MPMTKSRDARLQPGRVGVALFALTTIAFALVAQSVLIERWELYAYDLGLYALQRARSFGWTRPFVFSAPKTQQLVVVAVDDASVSEFPERLPMSRRRLADLIRTLGQAGASVTALDYFVQGQSQDLSDDAELLRSVKENGRVMIVRRAVMGGGTVEHIKTSQSLAAYTLAQVPVWALREADSLFRGCQVFCQQNGRLVPSLALAAVTFHWRLDAADLVPPAEGEPPELILSHPPEHGPGTKIRIPLYRRFSILLDLASRGLPFRVVSFRNLKPLLKKEPNFVRGKIVLVGNTTVASNDHHAVPISPLGGPTIPGVFLQGLAISSILNQSIPRRVSSQTDLILLVVLGAVAALLLTRLSDAESALSLILLGGCYALASKAVFLITGVWVGLFVPEALLAALYCESVWLRFSSERNARARCEVLLSSYFSPAGVVGLDSPDDPSMADRLLSVKEVLEPDRYEIVSKLGQGGMSVVFRARQKPMGRIVALKFISPRLFRDADARSRFLREAAVAGSLMHPNLVAVFDSGESHGVPFMALEFVEGESLRSLIERRSRLNVSESMAILKETLKGLVHIHEHGIIHRDIKSENILLSRDNQVKITDFGIAKMTGGNAYDTMQEIILGTPAYLAPELIRGDKPTAVSDLYSLGIVLFEMLTGSPPFLGDSTARILMRHVNDPVPDPSALGIELPRSLVTLLKKSLEKQPEDRFQSASELLVEVQKLFPDVQTPTAVVASDAAPVSVSRKLATVSIAPTPNRQSTVATRTKPPSRSSPTQ